jgi:hypothetical protein
MTVLSPAFKNRLISYVFLIVFINAAVLTHTYYTEMDVTANGSNTLSKATQKVLANLPQPVQIKVYLKTAHPLRRQIKQLITRYQQQKPNLSLQFIDPERELAKVQGLTISSQGLIIVESQGRSEQIAFLDELSLTNALLQFTQQTIRWVSFLSGHGERSPTGIANFDLGIFGKQLVQRNSQVQSLNLAQINTIPDNSAVLVLAAPRVPLLAGELQLIQSYLKRGGNLLLLTDPDNTYLQSIEQQLGIIKLPGTLIDNGGKLYGIDDPHFALVSQYPRHTITQGLQSMTVYPTAAALAFTKNTDFQAVPILFSGEQTWTDANDNNRFDPQSVEKYGSLPLAYALTRELPNKPQQRIVVVGDGDFLSNTFVGNVGNQEMGLRLFNWLSHDDRFVDIPLKVTHGRSLQFRPLTLGAIGVFFMLVLPISLIVTGFVIYYKRRRR